MTEADNTARSDLHIRAEVMQRSAMSLSQKRKGATYAIRSSYNSLEQIGSVASLSAARIFPQYYIKNKKQTNFKDKINQRSPQKRRVENGSVLGVCLQPNLCCIPNTEIRFEDPHFE